jgi:hypothetical protein
MLYAWNFCGVSLLQVGASMSNVFVQPGEISMDAELVSSTAQTYGVETAAWPTLFCFELTRCGGSQVNQAVCAFGGAMLAFSFLEPGNSCIPVLLSEALEVAINLCVTADFNNDKAAYDHRHRIN